MFVLNANQWNVFTPTMAGAAPIYSTFAALNRNAGLWYDSTLPDNLFYPSGWRSAEQTVINSMVTALQWTYSAVTNFIVWNGVWQKNFADKYPARYNNLLSVKVWYWPAAYKLPNTTANNLNYNSQQHACDIGSWKYAIINQNLTTLKGSVVIATKSGENLTYWTPSDISDSSTTLQHYSICKVAADKFIVMYYDTAWSPWIYAKVWSVSWTTISWGSPVALQIWTTSQSWHLTSAYLLDNTVILWYWKNTDSYHYARVCTISGTTITLWTETKVSWTLTDSAWSYTYSNLKLVALTATTVVFAWYNFYNICTISGTTITAGSQNSWNWNWSNANQMDLVKIHSSAFAVVYISSNYVKVAPYSVSWTTGTAQTIYQPSTTTYNSQIWACYLADNKIAIVCPSKNAMDSSLTAVPWIWIFTFDGSYNATRQSVINFFNMWTNTSVLNKLITTGANEFLFLWPAKSTTSSFFQSIVLWVVSTYEISTFKTSFELYNKDEVTAFYSQTDIIAASNTTETFYCFKEILDTKLYLTLKNTSAWNRHLYLENLFAYID